MHNELYININKHRIFMKTYKCSVKSKFYPHIKSYQKEKEHAQYVNDTYSD